METKEGKSMKKLVLLLVILSMASVCYGRTHEYEDPMGVGANVTLYEIPDSKSVFNSIGVEYKYDFNNHCYSVFGVMELNLHQAIENILED